MHASTSPTITSASERHRLTIVETPPARHLRASVDGFAAYSESTPGGLLRRQLASTRGVLVLNLGEAIEVIDGTGTHSRIGTGEGFVGGAFDTTATVGSGRSQEGIHVYAPLETFRRLFRVPLRDLANRVVAFDMLSGPIAELGRRLCDERGTGSRLRLLEREVARRLSESDGPDRAMTWVRHRLRSDPGCAIRELASELGWSRRHLSRRFSSEVGMTPRTFARLARFERFVESLRTTDRPDLAGLAADAGYFDQPHLNREVRAFAHTTPGELVRSRIPGDGGFHDDGKVISG